MWRRDFFRKEVFMKRFKLLALVLALVCIPMSVFAQRNLTLRVNGKAVESKPAAYIEKDRTMVPIRFVAESLDYQVYWNKEGRDIFLTKMNFDTNKPEAAIYLKADSAKVLLIQSKDVEAFYNATIKDTFKTKDVEGILKSAKSVPLEVKPVMKEDRAFIPLRAVVELFDQKISWDGKTFTVSIDAKVAKNDEEIAATWLYNKLPAEYKKAPFKLIDSLDANRDALAAKHIYAYNLIEDHPDHRVTVERYRLDLNKGIFFKYDAAMDKWIAVGKL